MPGAQPNKTATQKSKTKKKDEPAGLRRENQQNSTKNYLVAAFLWGGWQQGTVLLHCAKAKKAKIIDFYSWNDRNPNK